MAKKSNLSTQIINQFQLIEKNARNNKVPVILDDTAHFIVNLIIDNNIKTVLEIGSAIGYSALIMEKAGAKITTIEKNEIMYDQALENIKNNNSNIKIILSDALLVDINNFSKIDLLFIDAAKSKYYDFFNKFKHLVNNGKFILFDNINIASQPSENVSRSRRSLIKKVNKFIDEIDRVPGFIKLHYANIGDGLILLKKDNELGLNND